MDFSSSNSNTPSPVGQLILPATTQGDLLFPRSAATMDTAMAPDCNLNYDDWAGLCGELEGLGPILDFNTMAEQTPSLMAQTPIGDLGCAFDFNMMPPHMPSCTAPTFIAPSTPPCEPFELPATPVKPPTRTPLPGTAPAIPTFPEPSSNGSGGGNNNNNNAKIPPPSADQPRTWDTWAPWINSLTDAEVRKLETRQLAPLYYVELMTDQERDMTTRANLRLQQAKNYKRRQINNAAAAKSRRKKVEDRDRAVQECELEREKNKRLSAEVEHLRSENKRLSGELARYTGV